MSGRSARGSPVDDAIGDLSQLGFLRSHKKRVGSGGIHTVYRASTVDGCFENLSFWEGRNDVVVSAIVSVLPGYSNWEKVSVLRDIKACYARLTRIVPEDWRKKVLRYGPKRVQALAQQFGAELLARTKLARVAAKFYLGRLPPRIDDLEAFWYMLKKQATTEQREQAKLSLRLRLLPQGADSSNDNDRFYYAYQIASYTMTMSAERAVPLGFFPAGTDPEVDDNVACCFHVMASCIYGEPGCELICFE